MRTRSLANLIEDVRKRADVEGAEERHTDADITRYINQGYAALRDLLTEVMGRRYFRAKEDVSVVRGQSEYPLNVAFQSLLLVRIVDAPGEELQPLQPHDEVWIREGLSATSRPTHYDLTAGNIEFLPTPQTDITIRLEYIPILSDLSDPAQTLDGVNGWEDYVVYFAAAEIAAKDDERGAKADCERDMANLEVRIRKGSKRDRFRAERVKDARNAVLPLIRLPRWFR